jgi:hypothetical protein
VLCPEDLKEGIYTRFFDDAKQRYYTWLVSQIQVRCQHYFVSGYYFDDDGLFKFLRWWPVGKKSCPLDGVFHVLREHLERSQGQGLSELRDLLEEKGLRFAEQMPLGDNPGECDDDTGGRVEDDIGFDNQGSSLSMQFYSPSKFPSPKRNDCTSSNDIVPVGEGGADKENQPAQDESEDEYVPPGRARRTSRKRKKPKAPKKRRGSDPQPRKVHQKKPAEMDPEQVVSAMTALTATKAFQEHMNRLVEEAVNKRTAAVDSPSKDSSTSDDVDGKPPRKRKKMNPTESKEQQQ